MILVSVSQGRLLGGWQGGLMPLQSIPLLTLGQLLQNPSDRVDGGGACVSAVGVGCRQPEAVDRDNGL